MYRKLVLALFILLFMAVTAMAQDADNHKGKDKVNKVKNKASEAKELSGMSIVGNDEAPKSLYIVPWKSSEIGMQTSLNSMLNEGDRPVDREVFKRQLEFYRISNADSTH